MPRDMLLPGTSACGSSIHICTSFRYTIVDGVSCSETYHAVFFAAEVGNFTCGIEYAVGLTSARFLAVVFFARSKKPGTARFGAWKIGLYGK